MRKIAFLAALLSISLVSTSFGHNGAWNDGVAGDLTLESVISWVHEDEDPFKGTATVFVTNTGQQAWGDFHFEIYTVPGFGSATSVLIKDASTGGVNPTITGYGSIHSLDTPNGWIIGTTDDGHAKIDLFFYNSPVLTGQTVSFTIYTDNTAQNLDFFGIKFNPTPVPEPATMAMLALGGLLAFRRKIR